LPVPPITLQHSDDMNVSFSFLHYDHDLLIILNEYAKLST